MPVVNYTAIDGEIIAENRAGSRKLYVPDAIGSTIALVDNTQAITDTWTYWPYGEESNRTGTTVTPFRYVGKLGYYRDANSRSYVRARQLRPDHGRWLTSDPIGFKGGDWNLFRYVGNNPITAFDQMGTFSCFWCGALGLEHPCGQSWCWSNCDDGKNCKKPPPAPDLGGGSLCFFVPYILFLPGEGGGGAGFTPPECFLACMSLFANKPRTREYCMAFCGAAKNWSCMRLFNYCIGFTGHPTIAKNCMLLYLRLCWGE